MQVVLPDFETRAKVEVEPGRPMDDDEFFEFCARNPDLRIEREANGDLIIMPPAGYESSFRNNEISAQLRNWAKADRRGVAVDSSAEYLLPGGAAMGPDASWILKTRLAGFSKKQKERFLPLVPDFVIELMSPSDRLRRVKAKMEQWLAAGVQLGWLIDADRRKVVVYRPGREPEELTDPNSVTGEGPVQGFRLELEDVWRGL